MEAGLAVPPPLFVAGAFVADFSTGAGRVEVTPGTAEVDVNGSFRLTATVYDSRGNVISAQVAWTSSNTDIATVDNSGRVRGVREGFVLITATSGDKAGTAIVRVRK